jgi:hypothetical protein
MPTKIHLDRRNSLESFDPLSFSALPSKSRHHLLSTFIALIASKLVASAAGAGLLWLGIVNSLLR